MLRHQAGARCRVGKVADEARDIGAGNGGAQRLQGLAHGGLAAAVDDDAGARAGQPLCRREADSGSGP